MNLKIEEMKLPAFSEKLADPKGLAEGENNKTQECLSVR